MNSTDTQAGVVDSAVKDSTTGTVSRALQLLALLADANGNVTVKQVAHDMQLAPSTAHRLLQLLKKEGFVESSDETRQYAIGPRFYRIAALVANSTSPKEIALPVITAIANTFDETVLFGMYLQAEQSLSFAARADGQQKLRYEIAMNKGLSLVWGASGKVILAFLPEDKVAEILASESVSPVTGDPVPSLEDLQAEFERIRAVGYAVSDGEKLPDARGIAAPVYGPRGVIGCICLTSPRARMPHAGIELIGQELAAQAHQLSLTLGAKKS